MKKRKHYLNLELADLLFRIVFLGTSRWMQLLCFVPSLNILIRPVALCAFTTNLQLHKCRIDIYFLLRIIVASPVMSSQLSADRFTVKGVF